MATPRSKTVIGPKYREYQAQQYQQQLNNGIENPTVIHTPYVWCQIEIKRLSDLDTKKMTINVDFVLMLDWIDPSIPHDVTGDTHHKINLEEDHFSPYVRIHNCREAQVFPIEHSSNRLQSMRVCFSRN
jgi:hypothetical protein